MSDSPGRLSFHLRTPQAEGETVALSDKQIAILLEYLIAKQNFIPGSCPDPTLLQEGFLEYFNMPEGPGYMLTGRGRQALEELSEEA